MLAPYVPSNKLDPRKESQKLAWIIHSSGSTSLPKPIWSTHAAALGNFKSAFDLVSFVTLPLFHAQGIGWVFRGIMNKKPVYLYPAELPLTTFNLVKTLREHGDIQIMFAVPYICRLLADSDEGVELCKRLEFLFSGGAICPKPTGDKLAQAGVNLVSHYGSTETGQLMNSFRPRSEILEWDWLRPLESALHYTRWEPYDNEENICELVILEGWPAKVATNRKDGAYATADLWERHPEYPRVKKWRYLARRDDTIVLVNGEKANPVLFEQLVCESPLVQDAIVFGSEKSRLGMFVMPTDSSVGEEVVRGDIWPAVEKANLAMPAHAQLDRDMIKMLSTKDAEKVRKTDKGNIIRAAFYKELDSAIDAAYEDTKVPVTKVRLEGQDLLSFLRSEILASLSEDRQPKLNNGTDLFSLGVDSLQASRIRSAILKRGMDTGQQTVSENFVFDFPSIQAMADELTRMQAGGPMAVTSTAEDRMQALIDEYRSGFEAHKSVDAPNAPNAVVITGATGSLGAHLLSQVSFRNDVDRVFCLVRATSDDEALNRVWKSLSQRKVNANWSKISVFASDFSDTCLGLRDKKYEKIANNLRCIIHSAWSVNFNMSLESFEPDCIQGTRHLIDLCLHSRAVAPAEFVFCSSISAAANEKSREIPEDIPSSLKAAQHTGYAQSKLVAEHICLNATTECGIVSKVLRIGQVAGDTRFGIWNTSEAVPMMLKSASTIGSLPMLDEWCSWLPVDTVATIISDIALKAKSACGVFNIVNPKSFHWTWDLLLLLREIGAQFKVEDRREWVRRLRSMSDPVKNPPYKLIDFFEAKYGKDALIRPVVYASDKTMAASPALKHVPALDQRMVAKAIQYILDG
jgi:thioester reductase-like protein